MERELRETGSPTTLPNPYIYVAAVSHTARDGDNHVQEVELAATLQQSHPVAKEMCFTYNSLPTGQLPSFTVSYKAMFST